MPKIDQLGPLLAGLGVGIAASILWAPDSGSKTRSRIGQIARRAGDALKERAENLGDAANDVLEDRKLGLTGEQNQKSQTMSDVKDKAKKKIDDAAEEAKKAAGHVVDKSRDLAHNAGKKMEEGGQRLQSA